MWLKVKAIICIGVNNDKIIRQLGRYVDVCVEAASMQEAVEMAYQLGTKGDQVLLSPACASFDRFNNYEDRGNQFKSCYKSLAFDAMNKTIIKGDKVIWMITLFFCYYFTIGSI